MTNSGVGLGQVVWQVNKKKITNSKLYVIDLNAHFVDIINALFVI